MAGAGDYFYFGAGASYAYYVIDRLAPGIDIQYSHIFLNEDYGYSEPHTFTLLPFLKFAVMRSPTVSPYLVLTGGYQAEWGSDIAVNAWIVGGGGGVRLGLGEHLALNVQLLGLYYWYDEAKIYGYPDNRIYQDEVGNEFLCDSAEQCAGFGKAEYAYKSTEDGLFHLCKDEPDDSNICSMSDVRIYECNATMNCIPEYDDQDDVKREFFFPLITFGLAYFF